MSVHNFTTLAKIIRGTNNPIASYNIFHKPIHKEIERKVSQDDALIHALVRFSNFGSSTLAVVDDNDDIVGIYTQRHYMKNISWLEGISNDIKIGEIMQSKYHDSAALHDTKILTCFDKLRRHNINELFVLNNANKKDFDIVLMNDIIDTIIPYY